MVILAGFAIGIIMAVYIAWPWIKVYMEGDEIAVDIGFSGSPGSFAQDDELGELYSQRDAARTAIEELEFDLKSGTLSNEDFDELKGNYEAKADSILKQIDDKEKGAWQDSEIEKQIMELRQGVACFCPECGGKCREDDKFCVQCGASL
ncbi:MAG: hypothetical protein HN929_04035 [Chloroflexi bacterium]|jgi:hypothetical protein|nr:hypothetical protein [Chloroflexota bacterium]MBT7080625.1 hypothetical protein [Chloroflexota bacterium]MBT7289986.1 hypothetical protein [Chloroflexota bacterium]